MFWGRERGIFFLQSCPQLCKQQVAIKDSKNMIFFWDSSRIWEKQTGEEGAAWCGQADRQTGRRMRHHHRQQQQPPKKRRRRKKKKVKKREKCGKNEAQRYLCLCQALAHENMTASNWEREGRRTNLARPHTHTASYSLNPRACLLGGSLHIGPGLQLIKNVACQWCDILDLFRAKKEIILVMQSCQLVLDDDGSSGR